MPHHGRMTDLPAGYTVRPPTGGDLEAVGDALVADQLAAGFAPTLDSAYVERVWSKPDFHRDTDAWVVANDAGAVVAHVRGLLGR